VGLSPAAVAVNPVTNKIYVAIQSKNSVTVIDGATNTIAAANAGALPFAIAVNPVTNKVYVANANSNNVTVIDGASNTTITVGAGTRPVAVAVNPVSNKIYVVNQFPVLSVVSAGFVLCPNECRAVKKTQDSSRQKTGAQNDNLETAWKEAAALRNRPQW
jgi:YVTN family beta-propeller protein